jgi:hypothetical protein
MKLSAFKKGDMVILNLSRSAVERRHWARRPNTELEPDEKPEIAVITMIRNINYGQGRIISKAKLLWLTGKRMGRTNIFDIRDLKHLNSEQ